MKKICSVILMLVIAFALCSCSLFVSEPSEEGAFVGDVEEITLLKTSCKVNHIAECKRENAGFRICINVTVDNNDYGQSFYTSSFSLEDSDGNTYAPNPLSIYVGEKDTKTFNIYFDTARQINRTESFLRIKLGLLNLAFIKLKNKNNTCAITQVDKIDIPNEKVYKIGETATGSDDISYKVTKSFNCTTLPNKNITTNYNFLVVVFEIYNGRNVEFSLNPMDVYAFCDGSRYDYSSNTFLYSDGLSVTTGIMAKTTKQFAIIFETPTSSDVDDYTIRFPVEYGDYSGAYNYIWFSI